MPRIPTIKEGRSVRGAQRKLAQTSPGLRVKKVHHIGSKEWVDNGQWVGVVSSNVKRISYTKDTPREGSGILFVEFKNAAVYAYYEVSPDVAKGMFAASSQGKYVWKRLRGQFRYRRIA